MRAENRELADRLISLRGTIEQQSAIAGAMKKALPPTPEEMLASAYVDEAFEKVAPSPLLLRPALTTSLKRCVRLSALKPLSQTPAPSLLPLPSCPLPS